MRNHVHIEAFIKKVTDEASKAAQEVYDQHKYALHDMIRRQLMPGDRFVIGNGTAFIWDREGNDVGRKLADVLALTQYNKVEAWFNVRDISMPRVPAPPGTEPVQIYTSFETEGTQYKYNDAVIVNWDGSSMEGAMEEIDAHDYSLKEVYVYKDWVYYPYKKGFAMDFMRESFECATHEEMKRKIEEEQGLTAEGENL